ncbi:MAG: hypothetical protein M5U34_25470 [Chloroflexi bacterium]|nr:hypothetical protein [Chloroflexota bacterium]
MSRVFGRLERVLNLEAEQGYQNKAVVGGIRQFALFWVEQAREEAVDEADRILVEQTAELLMDYSSLPGVEARQKSLARLNERLKKRKERIGEAARKPAAPPPAKTNRPLPKPRSNQKPGRNLMWRFIRPRRLKSCRKNRRLCRWLSLIPMVWRNQWRS